MAKVILSSNAQQDLREIIANIIEYTGYENSGIKLAEDIFNKIDVIALFQKVLEGLLVKINAKPFAVVIVLFMIF
ncbi:hypothetical protein ACLSZY_05705 [Avibacterium volantium]|uniref:hypothetical protein n=1 Tax=Avibacterium TaxID=292486 RepID=UPI0039FCC6FA